MDICSGIYYGDASGGEYSAFPEIRRVGCRLVRVDDTGTLMFGAHFPLAGEIQTVPRGELYALVELIKQARPITDITYVTDNQWVSNSFNRGPKYACQCNSYDPLYSLFQITIDKAIKLTLRWMPSPLDLGKKKWPSDVTQLDVDGNKFADSFAGDAARLAEAPLEFRTDLVCHYKLVRRIQKRIRAIIQNLPPRQRKQNVLS